MDLVKMTDLYPDTAGVAWLKNDSSIE